MDFYKFLNNILEVDGRFVMNQFEEVFKESQDAIKDMNRLQLRDGENSENNTIGIYKGTYIDSYDTFKPYTEVHYLFKNSGGFITKSLSNTLLAKKKGNPWNLQWSGDFYRKFEVDYTRKSYKLEFSIYSKTNATHWNKIKELISTRGKDKRPYKVYGLNQSNMNKLSNHLRVNLINKIKNKIIK